MAVSGEDADGKRTVGSGSGSVLGHGGLRYKFSAVLSAPFFKVVFRLLSARIFGDLALVSRQVKFSAFSWPQFSRFSAALCSVFGVLALYSMSRFSVY